MEDGRLPDSAATAPIVMGRSGFDIKPTLTATLGGDRSSLSRGTAMARSVPIACTLGATGLAAQRRRWERLMTEALTGREETPDGLRLSFRPGAEDELRALVAIERECCP